MDRGMQGKILTSWCFKLPGKMNTLQEASLSSRLLENVRGRRARVADRSRTSKQQKGQLIEFTWESAASSELFTPMVCINLL